MFESFLKHEPEVRSVGNSPFQCETLRFHPPSVRSPIHLFNHRSIFPKNGSLVFSVLFSFLHKIMAS